VTAGNSAEEGTHISGIGDHLWVSKPSRYVISHPGQLSLAIPPWVDSMSNDGSGRR